MLRAYSRVPALSTGWKLLCALAVISLAVILVLHPLNRARVDVENKAIIIDALALDSPNEEFIASAVQTFESAGFAVDLVNGSDVTVEKLKNLPSSYEAVVFRVHSEAFMNQVFLFTSEPYSDFKHLPEQMRFEVTGARPGEQGSTVFAVGLNFMRRYMADKFNGSTVIVMGCRGMYNGTGKPGQEDLGSDLQTAEWFLEQGASAYIGWDGLVDLHHTDRATMVLLEALYIEKLDAVQAVEETMKEMGPDAHGSVLRCILPNK
jgi:hypothetical protein